MTKPIEMKMQINIEERTAQIIGCEQVVLHQTFFIAIPTQTMEKTI